MCYGLTLLIVRSEIITPIREMFKYNVKWVYKLLNCMMCTGFWVGLFVTLTLNFSPTIYFFYTYVDNIVIKMIYPIFDAAFISGMIWVIHLIQLNIEINVKQEL